MLVHLSRALKAPLSGLSLRPLIVLSIIAYLFAVVCIGQLRHPAEEKQRVGPPGVDASPVLSDGQQEGDGRNGDEDEDEDSPATADVETAQLVKRSEVQDPSKVRSFAGPPPPPPPPMSNSIVGFRRPGDDDDDEEDDDDDEEGGDRDDDDDDENNDNDVDERNGERAKDQAKEQKSTGGNTHPTQANRPAPTSLINRIMNFGGFGRATGGSGVGEQQKNSKEPERARLFKLAMIIGR